jgi:hypothetical protein
VLRIVFFKNLAKENNSPIGKNLPNLVALIAMRRFMAQELG